MLLLRRMFFCLMLVSVNLFPCLVLADGTTNIPILCYHNLNPTKPGSMNLTPKRFEEQLNWLKENGFTVISLNDAVEYLKGSRSSLPEKSVVITVDDGWESVYTYMYPLIKKYNIPVTLFIYPQTISEGKNAMTWEQIKELQQTGLFTVQGHTYDHPNFKQSKKRMSVEKFDHYVQSQLTKSKKILEEELGTKITLLAWPFGIYNDYLEKAAENAGYDMAFTIDARTANRSFAPMAQPRYLIVADQSMKTFEAIVNTAKKK